MNIFTLIENEQALNTWQAYDIDTKETIYFPREQKESLPLKENHTYQFKLIRKYEFTEE